MLLGQLYRGFITKQQDVPSLLFNTTTSETKQTFITLLYFIRHHTYAKVIIHKDVTAHRRRNSLRNEFIYVHPNHQHHH